MRKQRFGSVIGLKPDFEERYIILHKHTFPGVLERISESNIRNYSIFLRDGILFSYYEYAGKKYDEDMQKIGEDKTTQDWWKLTDPMQEPLPTRKEGEWWAEMEEIYFFRGEKSTDIRVQRFACVAEEKRIENMDSAFPRKELSALSIHKLSLFRNEGQICLYSEVLDTRPQLDVDIIIDRMDSLFSRMSSERQTMDWKKMQEVFHAD
jgi:L-rhamnose mutarotase